MEHYITISSISTFQKRVEPDSLSIYAWSDEAGTKFPLVKSGGDRLQKYYSSTEEQQKHWYSPVLNVYNYKTYTVDYGWWIDTGNVIKDDQLIVMLGTDDVNNIMAGYYDPEAESHNDAMAINHNRYVCRYTIGLPNASFRPCQVPAVLQPSARLHPTA